MKVLGISCGRKNGNSELLLKQAFKAIEEKSGAETSFIRLQEIIARGHQKALAGKDIIAEKRKRFDKQPIALPEVQ